MRLAERVTAGDVHCGAIRQRDLTPLWRLNLRSSKLWAGKISFVSDPNLHKPRLFQMTYMAERDERSAFATSQENVVVRSG